jgi:formate hydrogenlyase subunit 3/multisubunit Na+/H+ antiporter MnhD subunit
MDRLLRGMAIFIEYPLLAAGIGLVLFWLGRRTRRGVAAGSGVLWILYALYETGMRNRWLCSGECNIRIDLLVIYPVLAIALVVGLISLARGLFRRRPDADQPE